MPSIALQHDTGATLAAPASACRRSAPIPWRAARVVERVVSALNVGLAARSERLKAALARPPALNRVAAERLMAACEAALGLEITGVRHAGARHCALTAAALTPLPPCAANDNEAVGIVVQQLLCLAGKCLDWREVAPLLEASAHALGRFVERSGHSDPAVLQEAVWAAARAADVMLLAHAEQALWRLSGGVAAVLLPAGHGAFLGHLRLLANKHGRLKPVIEAQTWVHAADLREGQAEVWEIMTSGLPVEELLRHLPEAMRGLRPAARGDRRLCEGLEVIRPGPEPGEEFRMALGSSQPVALARLRAGLACVETIAAERRGR